MECLFKNAERIAEMFTLVSWRENKIHNYYRLCSTRWFDTCLVSMITEQIMTEKGLLKAEVDKTSVKTN